MSKARDNIAIFTNSAALDDKFGIVRPHKYGLNIVDTIKEFMPRLALDEYMCALAAALKWMDNQPEVIPSLFEVLCEQNESYDDELADFIAWYVGENELLLEFHQVAYLLNHHENAMKNVYKMKLVDGKWKLHHRWQN